MSEMAFARKLVKGDKKERARLRSFPGEPCLGVQIATNAIEEGVQAAHLAHEAGATFVDLNCGCPIHEATRRGLGAALLRKPKKLATLVEGIAANSPIPLTVKIRTGESAKKMCAEELVPMLHAAGAAAVTIHGRTSEQRYKRPADWDIIERIAEGRTGPVIGNGDVLAHHEAVARLKGTSHALMVGRGALIKPWIFLEVKEGCELAPSAQERIEIYRQFVSYLKSYFHDDALGRKRAFYFLPWHFQFFHRYRPMPARVYAGEVNGVPMMSRRQEVHVPEIGEEFGSLSLLERLLRCPNEKAHFAIANALWDSANDKDAIIGLDQLAASCLPAWEEEIQVAFDDDSREG